MDERLEELYQADRRLGNIINAFAGLALFVACLGLYGLASFVAERRTKEIGIRKVLGASIPAIIYLLTRDFIKWIVIAIIVIGIGIFILKGEPFKVGKSKGFSWPLTGVLVGVIGVIAFWAADVWEGFPRGLSFTTPTGELFFTLLTGNAKARFFRASCKNLSEKFF